ncbi:UDP-glucose 6-dehydrogenase [Kordiimonas sediminis]|uniref:UDP-glucose 6-dehydrogenase n=1 Tax=Kordiimonas sediminis TaxID=1735581 RepID=A0A919ANL6_9PROT|nr:UDP-glucose/GDP-mannose dehydrogenase family protein [Kordiimonas sediminis]GHF15738.1 UDP-glucose 6-dehydrogenase [Kordiimonas sediminis]
MKIAVIGTGYVGLVSGTCFAEFGHEVTCVDKDATKVENLKAGIMPIYEPGLDTLVNRNVATGKLQFTTDLKSAMDGTEAVFIAVGTPSRRGDGHADLQYVFKAVEEVASYITTYTVVITKSTVPVGTGKKITEILSGLLDTSLFDVASNPEFLREGAAIEDFMRPNRVVVGTETDRARDVMKELYRPLFLNETPMVFTNRETAEVIKYAANAFLATKISFINEMADLCEKVGADVQQVSKGIGLDKRIGGKFLNAGPGYGGSCFPKDTRALIHTAEDYDVPMEIVRSVVTVNENRKQAMAQKIIDAAGGTVDGKKIAVLGLTFKPNTDDMRESPSLDIIPALQNAGASVHAHDPQGMEEAEKLLENVTYHQDPYDTMHDADILVLITEWNEFRALNMTRVKSLLKSPVVVDLRNIYGHADLPSLGFTYIGIGR